jgi:hypothetical protein
VIPAVAGGDIASTVNLTAIPEPGKVNLLANIISACVNGATSAAPECTSLFNAALPPAANTTSLNGAPFPTATDTLQALFYMFTNPTNGQGANGTTNLSTLFGLAGGIGAPYQPSAAQPTDWTIAISYNSSSNCGTGTSSFIQGPVDVNIDGQNNVWIANSVGGNLSAISAAGAPLACVNMDPGTSNGGGTVDVASNIWYGAGTTMYRYNPTTRTTVAFPTTTLAFPAGVSPLGITADGVGNVYFTAVAGPTGSLFIIPGASSAAAAVAPVQISSTVGPNPIRLMPDATSATPKTVPGNIWVSSGSTFVSQVSKSNAAGNLNGWITTPFTTSGNSYGLSIGRNNNVATSGIDNNSITQLAFTAPSTWATASSFPFTAATAGITSPSGISVDGRSNTWIPNLAQNSISEISFFGANPLSQSNGFQKSSGYLNGSSALAIDQAGNVWIVGTANNFVTEIVGGAVPLFQPYSLGINIGRFQSIP